MTNNEARNIGVIFLSWMEIINETILYVASIIVSEKFFSMLKFKRLEGKRTFFFVPLSRYMRYIRVRFPLDLSFINTYWSAIIELWNNSGFLNENQSLDLFELLVIKRAYFFDPTQDFSLDVSIVNFCIMYTLTRNFVRKPVENCVIALNKIKSRWKLTYRRRGVGFP